MIRALAAVATVIGLILATTSNDPVLAGSGAALLLCGAVIVVRHPEYLEN